MKAWMEKLVAGLHAAFGARLRFAGLQGSRARGEAGPESDIDAVVILDEVSLQDVRAYRALLEAMPEREKVCGFFGGAAELARWDRGDLFSFVHDTIPFYGDLFALTPPLLGREDARRAALKGACDIYHGCAHGLLFDRDPAALRALYKMAAFALRAVYFCRAGEYVFRTDDLRERLTPSEARLLNGRGAARALTDDGAAYEELSERLLAWASGVICEMGGANANDTETRLRLNGARAILNTDN